MKVLRDSAILSLGEYRRIKNNSQFVADKTEDEKTREERHLNYLKRAEEYKNKLRNYDKTHINPNIQESEADRDNRIKNEQIIEKAKRIIESQDDLVKTMDKMVLYAKIASIRDKQLKDKKVQEEILKKKDEKLSVLSEIQRLKELKAQEEADNIIKQKRKEGSKIIMEQIEYNKKVAEEERKQVEREKKEMLENVAKLNKEAEEKLRLDKERGEEMLKNILEANARSAKEKAEKKQAEIDEDLKILAYNKEQARLENERLKAIEKEKEMKELELKKLREKQSKMNDNKAIMDEIRMKRAFEDNERLFFS